VGLAVIGAVIALIQYLRLKKKEASPNP